MNEETIELFYISNYELDGEWEKQKQGVSIIPRETYIEFLHETEWEPCVCNVQGCLSCFLDEKMLWADGYGNTPTSLWFGVDPTTGKQWNPEAILEERKKNWREQE